LSISSFLVGEGLVPSLALKGRSLNSLGFQPQVGRHPEIQTL
jgi:hypothetical protein